MHFFVYKTNFKIKTSPYIFTCNLDVDETNRICMSKLLFRSELFNLIEATIVHSVESMVGEVIPKI